MSLIASAISSAEEPLLPLHERLAAYFELLLSRPDVHVHQWERSPAGRLSEADAAQLPPEVAELYRHMNGLRCWWVFKEDKADVEEYRRGYSGGFLNLRPIASGGVQWSAPPAGSAWAAASSPRSLLLDELSEEGHGAYLAPLQGDRTGRADIWYVGDEPMFAWFAMGSFAAYLARGAHYAFALDWQRASEDDEPHAATVRAQLLGRSLRDTTDRALVDARLRARGASPEASASLIDWLGDDIALLLPK
jgi:hypothetical protein